MKTANVISLKIISGWFFVSFLAFAFLLTNQTLPQSEYNMSLTNVRKISSNTLEFEIIIAGSNEIIHLTSYQCSFLFNTEIANGGDLNFLYVEGSSQLTNLPSFGIGINFLDGNPKLTFASMAGSDTITGTLKLIGRFQLENTTSFPEIDPDIQWNFDGNVSTILTGENFQDITIPSSHTYNLALGINMRNSEILEEFKLLQNYPNPFNSTTKITINIPEESNVNLTVYDLLGQKIEDIIAGSLREGLYDVDFTGKGLPSGTYFCKLTVNGRPVEIIKMILLR